MKIFLFALLLALSSTVVVEGLFLGGLGILAVKAGLLGGLALSRRRTYSYRPRRRYSYRRYRYGRSVEDEDETETENPIDDLIIQADLQDIDDCAKMFVCELNTKTTDNLDKLEQVVKTMFGTNEGGALDVTKPSVRFDLAAVAGKTAGLEQCKLIYGRCKASYNTMLKIFEDSALGKVPIPDNLV